MKKQTFVDTRIGIEREILPMSMNISSERPDLGRKQELEILDVHPKIAWLLIDVFTELGMEVKVWRDMA